MDHNPGIDELVKENWGLITSNLENILDMHQRYRDQHRFVGCEYHYSLEYHLYEDFVIFTRVSFV